MDNSKNLLSWQPPSAPYADPQLGFAQELQPLNPYPNNHQQAGYQSGHQADQFIDDESERRSNGKERKKHKKGSDIIWLVVFMLVLAGICVGITFGVTALARSSEDYKASPIPQGGGMYVGNIMHHNRYQNPQSYPGNNRGRKG